MPKVTDANAKTPLGKRNPSRSPLRNSKTSVLKTLRAPSPKRKPSRNSSRKSKSSRIPLRKVRTPSRKIKLSKFDRERCVEWKSKAEKHTAEAALEKMVAAYETLIKCVGDDNPGRGGLKNTPRRAAKALCYFTKGYEEDVAS